jgi:endonuclease/exonuclease/phosphatase family metal-dependent hydrolase
VWRHGPLQLNALGVANATTVDYDFLAILLAELAERGENYRVVTDTTEADVEGPAFLGAPGQVPATNADRRLTMHDVILSRVEGNIKVLDTGTGNYSDGANFALSIGGIPFKFTRGYGWADVVVKKRAFRFINTHLESQFSIFAKLQALELLAGPAAPQDQPVVLVCDCNSDPLNHTTKPGDPTPHSEPYEIITGAGGFTDEWLEVAPASAGWTSGLSETVNDADLSQIDHRIDMVFGRRADGSAIPADRGWIVGDSARTAGGLWASDHMGVVMRLKP